MGYKDARDKQLMDLLRKGKTYADIAKLSGTSVANMKSMVKRKDPDLYRSLRGSPGRPPASPEQKEKWELEKQRRREERDRLRAQEKQRHTEILDYLFEDDVRTLDEVGEQFGITREYVRQLARRYRSVAYDERKKRRHKAIVGRDKAKREKREREHRENHQCRVCGVPLEVGRSAFCGQEHYEMWVAFRYHTDEEHRRSHQKIVARWMLANAEKVPDHQLAYARRVLDDETEEVHGRWFIRGSGNLERAIKMCQEGYPMFDLLPQELQEQVRNVIAAREAEEELTMNVDGD